MRGRSLIVLLLVSQIWCDEWDAYNFPNPTAGQFKECNMKTTANICDPDGVLDVQSRYRLDHDLKQLESRTRQDFGKTFCDKKGVTAAMAVARHVKGGTTEAVEAMANDMLRKWTLDPQCKKAVVIVVSTDDMKFWVARDDKVPIYAEEFTQLFMQQKTNFQQGNYQLALSNILQGTWEKALSKQGSPRKPPPRGNTGGGGGQGPGTFGGGGGRQGPSGPAFKVPSIPKWFWLLLIGVIIPLLCCCCCLYCCCCRKGGSGGGQRVPTDAGGGMGPAAHGGMGPGPRAGGGGRSPFSNFMSSMGGAGIGSMLGRMLSNRGGGGGAGGMGMGGMGGNRGFGMGGYQGGGAYPDAPIYDDNGGEGGGGLYPSREVKDRGGGGSWA